jgi:hypothetical protein
VWRTDRSWRKRVDSHGFRTPSAVEAVDFVQPSVAKMGGITELLKVFPIAAVRNVHDGTTPEEARVDSGEAEQEPWWVLSSGAWKEEQTIVPPMDTNRQWDFRIGKNGVIEHFRSSDGRVAVRETGDKIEILDPDHDSLGLALERAVERFGGHLHFDGNQAGARTLVDIVVTHDLAVTFTDDRLNAQIQLRRTQNGLDRGHSIATSEPAQTVA